MKIRSNILASIRKHEATFTNLDTGKIISFAPFVCVEKIGNRKHVKSVGNKIHELEKYETVYPFTNMDPIIVDPEIAGTLISHGLMTLLNWRQRFIKPNIVLAFKEVDTNISPSDAFSDAFGEVVTDLTGQNGEAHKMFLQFGDHGWGNETYLSHIKSNILIGHSSN